MSADAASITVSLYHVLFIDPDNLLSVVLDAGEER
jgi:hypothetical protein